MCALGDKRSGIIGPQFDRSISIDFHGGKITSATGFLVMSQVDQRFNILGAEPRIDDSRSNQHFMLSAIVLLSILVLFPAVYLHNKQQNSYINWDGGRKGETRPRFHGTADKLT
jgi:hypothetical protein